MSKTASQSLKVPRWRERVARVPCAGRRVREGFVWDHPKKNDEEYSDASCHGILNAAHSHQDATDVLGMVEVAPFVQKMHPQLSISLHVVVECAILLFALACVVTNVSTWSTKKCHGGHLFFGKVRKKLG